MGTLCSKPKKMDHKQDKDAETTGGYFLIRHSERVDQVDDPIEGTYDEEDPGITDDGKLLAKSTGKLVSDIIDKLLKSNPEIFDKDTVPLILASPYLRCVQTAVQISKGLAKAGKPIHDDTIFLEDGCTERQDDRQYNNGSGVGQVLEIERKNPAEMKNLFEGFKSEKNRWLDYKNYPVLVRQAYERNDRIWERFDM
jgi:broad specificity phosphatase PhoE